MFAPSFATRTHLALLLAALLGGCAAVVPPSQIPASSQALAGQTSPAAHAATIATGQPAANWWQALNDPQLDALLRQAMQYNHQRQAALATVRAARSSAEAASREALPQGSLGVGAQRQQLASIEVDPYRQGLPRAPVHTIGSLQQSLSWELDLFGRVATAAGIAQRQADARSADLHAATVLLQGEVVRHYTLWQYARQADTLWQAELHALQQQYAQLQSRQSAGLADPREVWAAANASRQAQAGLAANHAQLAAAAAALAVLCGDNPRENRLLALATQLPAVPPDTAIVYPHDLLARRPDVARADAELRAALGEAALAERAHLPRLSFNLAAGVTAPFGQMGNTDALRYALGPAFSWDWLDAGRRAARRAGAEHGRQAAWHQYEHTVLTALQEAESSLRQWQAAKIQLDSANAAASLAGNTARYTQARSQAGLVPQAGALAHAAQWQQAQRTALAARSEALLAYVQVQLALGAWQAADSDAG